MRIWVLLLSLSSFYLSATQLKLVELQHVEQALEPVLTKQWLQQKGELEQKLQPFSAIEQTLLRSRLLKLLSQNGESEQHRSWVKAQLASKQVLTTLDTDHPRKSIELVNIAAEAQAVLDLWRVQQYATVYQQQWLAKNWSWQQFEQSKAEHKNMGLALAIGKADVEVFNWLLESAANTAELSNSSLYLLAMASKDKSFFQRLWSRSGDEFSYRLLQQTPTLLPEEQAIQSLQQASLNQSLTSQAYILLAKHFAHSTQVQDYLFAALEQGKTRWLAAAAIASAAHPQLTDRLSKISVQTSNPAITFALQQLTGAQE